MTCFEFRLLKVAIYGKEVRNPQDDLKANKFKAIVSSSSNLSLSVNSSSLGERTSKV